MKKVYYNRFMKNKLLPLGIIVFLASCGYNSSQPKPNTGVKNTEIPPVPRNVNTGDYVCPTGSAAAPLSQRLNMGHDVLDQGTHVELSRLKAQSDLPDTLQDLLYTTKSIVNNMYYGYSVVDLDALHEQAYQNFKKIFPKKLNTYILTSNYFMYSNLSNTQQSQVDQLMSDYISDIKDGHTFYMNPDDTQADKQGAPPSPVLGVSLALVPDEDGLILTGVRLDSPAWKAGLRRGDVITGVNGTNLTRTAGSKDEDLFTSFRQVLGNATVSGQPMNLSVKTAGQTHAVTVTGAILKGTDMPWGEVLTDASGKQHYHLVIPTFMSVEPERTSSVPMPIASRVHTLVADARSKGIDNIIVDLRGNGGGLVTEFLGAVGPFVPDAQAGESTRYVDGSSMNFTYAGGKVNISDSCHTFSEDFAVQDPTKWTGKVVVLVDKYSASASEMFSTNFQHAGLKVIGDTTYGVGSTSTYHLDLPAGRSISVTAGRSLIDGKPVPDHVTPDVKSVDDLKRLADTGIDNTLQTAYNLMK